MGRPQGKSLVSDQRNFRIQKWMPGVPVGSTVAGGINVLSSSAKGLDAPTSIFLDKDGNLYIADAFNNRIQKWGPNDTVGTTVAGGNGQGGAANQLILPNGVFVDAAGYIYVSDIGNNCIKRFPPGSTSSTDGVTIAGIGDTQYNTGSGPGQLEGPLGVWVDKDGSLFIADQGNHRIQKYPPGATTGITVAGQGSGGPPGELNCPYYAFIDNHGDMYISDACLNRVVKWVPGVDTAIVVAGGNGFGDAPDQLFGPEGIFVDTAGNLYVADYMNNRVQEYRHHYTIGKSLVPSTPGTYTAIVTDGSGCIGTIGPVVIYPGAASSVSISASADDICAGTPVTFTAIPTNGGQSPSYEWRLNGSTAWLPDPSFIDSTLQNGDTLTCRLVSSMACTSPSISQPLIMTIRPKPSVFAGRDTVISPGTSISFDPVLSGAINNYQWTPTTGLDDPSSARPTATPVASTLYQLTVTGDDGCTASSKVDVIVYRGLKMPDAFTPNGDGINDLFRIPASTPQEISRFSVYDRWGALVFSTANSGIGWDGSFNGKRQPAGAYIWVIDYTDLLTHRHQRVRGTVMLIR
jgi:gliding motility-associated-like protein